jgi:uncharacterized protein YndB with AHSA1/START domain
MPASRYSAVVDAPVDAVWRRLADLSAWPDWLRAPYAGREVALERGEPGAGSRFFMKGALPFRLFARITEWRVNERLAFEIYGSEYPSDRLFFGRALISVDLEGTGDGRTLVLCTHELQGRGIAGRVYAATVMRLFLRRNVRWVVRGLGSRVASAG